MIEIENLYSIFKKEELNYVTLSDIKNDNFISKILKNKDEDKLIKCSVKFELQLILKKDNIAINEILKHYDDIMEHDLRLPKAYKGNLELLFLTSIIVSVFGLIIFLFNKYMYVLFPVFKVLNIIGIGFIITLFIWYWLTKWIPFYKLYRFKSVSNYDDFLNQMVEINRNRYDFNEYERIRKLFNSYD